MNFSTPSSNNDEIEVPMHYQPNRDLLWLASKPWILIPRLFQIITSLLLLITIILTKGNNEEESIQKEAAKKLLKILTDLGPCFIKLGQALSTRPDLVERHWLDELTNLQDNLPAFNHNMALETIKNDLGCSAHEIFEEFPDAPIAAASLGQVYKAKYKGDYWVAVKVQRPMLKFILRRDLVIIRVIGVIFGPILPLNLGIGLAEIIDEFGRSLFEEIDYLKEADNAERFARLFSNNPAITIPKVERSVSSERVITTSWIHGTKLREKNELEKEDLNTSSLIRTGVISGIQQLLEFGYFHADPHPGNMFALKGQTNGMGHIAYVDFGMMDSISDYDRLTLTGAVVHLINEDFDSLAKDFQKLGFLSSNQNLEKIVPVLKEVLGDKLTVDVGSFNFKAITDKFSELMYEYPFRVPARFALIIRAIVSQEGLALRLDSNFKIISVAYPYVAKRLLSVDTKEMLERLLEVIFDQNGGLRVERLENLLEVIDEDQNPNNSELIPIALAGVKLILGPDGSTLRKNLLLTLVKNEKINLKDIKNLIKLIRKKFKPTLIAKSLLQTLQPAAT